jgi:transitional endoplasmic reticulum ATPase
LTLQPAEGADLGLAILQRKNSPNTLLVDDSLADDHSSVTIDQAKMKELDLFNGDTVLLRGKKRKTTVAVVNGDDSVAASRVQMTKVVRSNLRYVYCDVTSYRMSACCLKGSSCLYTCHGAVKASNQGVD